MTESMSDEWVEEFQQKWTQEQAQDLTLICSMIWLIRIALGAPKKGLPLP